MNGALRIMTWNANGLLKHQEELQIVLEKEKRERGTATLLSKAKDETYSRRLRKQDVSLYRPEDQLSCQRIPTKYPM